MMKKSKINAKRKPSAPAATTTPSATTEEVCASPNFITLPPELRYPIISKLSISDALNIRLTCHTLNIEVLSFYPAIYMHITGDSLSVDQLTFLSRVNLKRITFKRVAKPIKTDLVKNSEDEEDLLLPFTTSSPAWICSRKRQYTGPCQYFQVGGVQIRSLSAPKRTIITSTQQHQRNGGSYTTSGIREKCVYDYAVLKDYLINISSDDIFKHI